MSSTITSTQISAELPQGIELELVGHSLPAPEHHQSLQRTDIGPETGNNSSESLTNRNGDSPSKWKTAIIIATISGISLINSMLGGIMIVSLPTMARDINLSGSLLLWPASVNALACGCTLLFAGSISDVVGGRRIYLLGVFLLTVTTIACGACTSGIQLILFRAAQGIAVSFCLPPSVSLITANVPTGTYRNIAFACLGAGQPIGFSIGLVLGGFLVQSIGWRYGYYIGAILTFIIFIISIFGIPDDKVAENRSATSMYQRIRTEIDWVGCALLSTSLGMFSYVFSVLASGASHFVAPASLTLFSIAIILIPLFAFHTFRQERLGGKVVIPPSLLGNRVFSSLCITVFVIMGVFEAMMFFLTLFYQSVQSLSTIQTSLRFLPMVLTGSLTNFLTGWLVKRVRADVLIFGSASLAAVGPLLMAVVDPSWTYWSCALIATACAPICADVLFTVSNLLITSVFPEKTHGLAGSIFNTVSNIGGSVGLAITSVVASAVTLSRHNNAGVASDLMEGYRAAFWLCFGVSVAILGVVGFGLRNIGKVGIKVE